MSPTREDQHWMYRNMVTSRRFEEAIAKIYFEGKSPAFNMANGPIPIPKMRARMLGDGMAIEEELDRIEAEAAARVDAAIKFARESDNAAPEDALTRVACARTNKLTVTEMTGGTFTVSNLGLTRVEHFTPIINASQICILGIGCMTDRAVRSAEGGIELRPHVGLSLTFDHRALDGAPAGDLLTTICAEIEGMQL
ncbi:2-oxo acid dehydrogenase subunit E2 [Neptunicoccus sediminis]|uniref:2-oxo acid dehydrogenase subunit E2 n=1 Tax=Neptunicoccus sediminis TaxID=1892596 RepID=UPI000B1814DF|nr:2-oxo acid dehydrogenase subunit E2 [Neptunicoccus sediminis]